MKKGVLLTGVLAAGLAAAPVTAKADVASAPQIHEDVKETPELAKKKFLDLLTTLDGKLADVKKKLELKQDPFTDIVKEAQDEALNDIVRIGSLIEKSRQDFYDLEAKRISGGYTGEGALTDEEFVKEVNKMIYHPVITWDQAESGLYKRYNHLSDDFKYYYQCQDRGDLLLGEVASYSFNDAKYKCVDQIKEVADLMEAVRNASKEYREKCDEYHGNRTKVWNESDKFHADDLLCLADKDAQDDVDKLYEAFEKAFGDLKAKVDAFATAREDLSSALETAYNNWKDTKSETAKDLVDEAKQKADDFITTFNAEDVSNWRVSKDGEDTKGTPFENLKNYNSRANDLIEALKKAIDESNANEDAYQNGLKTLGNLTTALKKDEYWNKAKETVGDKADDENINDWVYRGVITKFETIIAKKEKELEKAWNDWKNIDSLNGPWNAKDYVETNSKEFDTILKDIQKHVEEFADNEAKNEANHALYEEVLKRYGEMEKSVETYKRVKIADYFLNKVCELDGSKYNGTDAIEKGYDAFVKAERAAYDNIAAVAYNEEAKSENKRLLADIELLWNHIAVDQCQASLEYVMDYYDKAHEANQALDPVCDEMGEFGLTPHCRCLPEDTKDNPCGWCDPTAKAEHDAIEAGYRANVDLLDKKHAETLAKTLVNDFIMYEESAKDAVDQWTADFEKAHNAHMEKLLAALHTSTDQAHSLEHAAETAEHHLNSFTTGDRAAADAWVAAKGYEGVTNFAEYVNFLRENHELMGKIEDAYNEHHYTELVNLGVYADDLVKGADYTKAVEANKAAYDRLYTQLAAVAESVKGLETEWEAASAAVYATDKAAIKTLIAALEKVETLSVALTEAYESATAVEKEEALGDRIAALSNSVQYVRAEIVKALEFKYKNVEAASKLNEQIANLETLQQSLDTTWAVYEEIESGKDAKALNAAYQAISELIAAERLAIAADVAAGTVVANAETHEEKIGDINDAIKALQDNVRVFEKFYADNAAAKAELEGLFANLTADVTAAVIGDVYEADATILENERTQLLERINNEVKNVAGDFEKGEVCDNYENLKKGYAEFLKDVKGFVGRIKDAEKKLADNKAAAAAYIEQVNDLATVVRATVPGEVYEADLETLADAQTELLGKLFAENGVIDAALKAGTVLTDKATIEEAIAVLSIAVQEYQGKVKTAEKYLADSKAKAAAVSTAYNGLLDELKTLSYGDVYADEAAEIDERIATLKTGLQNELTIVAEDFENREVLDKDYTEPINNFTADVKGLNDFIKDCEKRLADNKAAKAELDSQLAAFQATVNGIVLNSETLYEDDYDTLFGKLDALRALIGTVSGEIAAAFDGKVATEYQFPSTLATKLVELQGEKVTLENLYAANVAAREAKLREIADLEVALEAVVLDAKQVYNTENHSNLDQLLDMAADIQTKIDDARTGLYAAFDAKTAPDYNVPANEISTAIKELKLAVSDFQEFKRQNIEKATLLYNDLTNLLAEIEGLKKYGPVYEDEVEGGYDKTHIDRQIETLINSLKGALNWLKNDLESGDVVANLDSYGQDYDFALEEIENIKAGIEAAEQLYAANLRALNNLEEMIMAEKTVLENTKAMCACNECNTEDKAAVDALVGTLDTILGNVNDAFADTKNLWQLEGQFKGQVDDVKADAANLLALVQLHLDRVQSDLRAYNVLQKALEDVELWLANVELEDGWENFAERNAHCSNPDVKYLNELTTDVNDLKALIDQQHSHEGGHSCEEYKIDDMKAMKALIEDAKTLIAAIQANNAAYALINDRYDELYNDALAAYKFWHQYYAEQTLNDDWYTANKGWIQEWDGELEAGDYLVMLKNYFDDLYNHGNAAYEWTVDAQGKELKDAATETFEKQDTDLAKDRNDLAHKEALNHWQTVKNTVDTAKFQVWDEYGLYDYWTDTTTWDPFAANVMKGFNEEFEGEFGMIASLNTFKADIEAAYAEGVMEDAINIDEHNTALGIHQQLNGVLGVLGMVMEEYADLFAESHHLTNGKKIYSDQEYFTLGFFEKANDGSVANGQEMFKEVKVLVNDDIRLYDSRAYVWNDMGTPDDWSDDEALVDEKGRVVYDKENNPGEIAEVNVLTVGQKSNELSFKFHQNPMALERATLKAGTAEVDFLPGSISVKGDNMAEAWVLKHTVSIDGIDVLAPEVADMEITPYATSGKLIVRVDNPIDLTYTINSLIARTDAGVEFSYADRELNYAAGQIEFTLPEGTQSVELPEGFFTFRTGENTIARSAACVVAVNNKTTSIDELVAMGEKAQIFDLQGRRVKAEALISGNTYVVNGEKKMVK